MKIAFFQIEEWEKEYLVKKLPGHKISFFLEHLDLDNARLAKGFDVISVFTASQMNKEMLAGLPGLKLIATRSTGFDNIDIQEAKKLGIIVCNVPTYGENTVAEHTFGLILNLSRKIYKSIQKVREVGFVADGLRGFDLKGKTLGIVGMGHIGQHVARIANGFEMNVVATDAHEDKALAENLDFTYVSLESLLKTSDVITLHVPHNPHTHHLINTDNIKLIKRGAYLINTARGGIVQTAALIQALDEGILAGAGLDVLEGEHELKEERELLLKKMVESEDIRMLLRDHILMERDNVIITPHNAFNSKEALERIIETTVESIAGFLVGKVVNAVN